VFNTGFPARKAAVAGTQGDETDCRSHRNDTMKALLINPETQSVEAIDIQSVQDIADRIGFETVISDEIGPDGDRLYFDEECFLRGTSGRFQIKGVAPVAGIGIVAGSQDDEALRDAASDVASLSARVRYL
jgi:hypothetical protein